MKKAPLLLLLLFLVSLSAAAAPRDIDREAGFPTISKFQVRQPISVGRERAVKAEDHDACGPNPSIPYNCVYACNGGVPMHYENGEPVLICWYEPDDNPGAGCQAGNQCTSNSTCWAAPVYQGCDIQTYSCSNC